MAATEKIKNQFGTFGGIFTPVILTILGVIMFMRVNYKVSTVILVNSQGCESLFA